MKDTQRELDRFARQERLRKLKAPAVFAGLLLVLVAVAVFGNRGVWDSTELHVVLQSIPDPQRVSGAPYRAIARKADGTEIQLTLPPSYTFRQGAKAVVLETVNNLSSETTYRYLRPAEGS